MDDGRPSLLLVSNSSANYLAIFGKRIVEKR